jgi:hypothetical protein
MINICSKDSTSRQISVLCVSWWQLPVKPTLLRPARQKKLVPLVLGSGSATYSAPPLHKRGESTQEILSRTKD